MKPTERQKLLLLVFYLVLLVLPIGLAPLMETTEARYGEIAREMLVTGNWLEPQFNGIKHFHKPPLAYWLTAAGMKLFGQNDFGARFCAVAAAVVTVVLLYRLARLVLEEEKKAFYAALIFATSWLFMAVTRLVSTEIYLTCFTILAQYALFRQLYGVRSRGNAILYGLALGLGFLTKGPIIFLFTLLPYLVAKLFDREHRKVFSSGEILLGTAIFLLTALPWYLAVIARNPGLLGYFLKAQTVDRVVTDRFHRYQPPWYFLAIFAGTFLPYLFFFLKGLCYHQVMPRRLKVLLLYVGVPLIVFSLAKGKHATYIVPFFGIAALWTAEVYARLAMPRLRAIVLVLLGLLALAPLATPLALPSLPGTWQIVAAAFFPVMGWLVWKGYRDRRTQRLLLWTAVSLMFAGCLGSFLYGQMSGKSRGYEDLTARLNAMDPARRVPVLVYRKFLPSISFYRQALAVMALGEERETRFERNGGYRAWYLTDDGEVRNYVSRQPRLFVVAKPREMSSLAAGRNLACEEVFVHRKVTAYSCRQKKGSPLYAERTGPEIAR
jgi:4-amino-4-deoxy-L-arabinose transferase-like glycosyltransferase